MSNEKFLQEIIQGSPGTPRSSQVSALLMNINLLENFPTGIVKLRAISRNPRAMMLEKRHAMADRPFRTDSASVIIWKVIEAFKQNAVIRRVHPPLVYIFHVDPERC
jgi:hypothetical protein